MGNTILVPLDGSALAEQALPWARCIAARSGAALCLTHVHVMYLLKDQDYVRRQYNPQDDARCLHQEQAYLDGVAQRLADTSGVPVRADVLRWMEPVDGILADARQRRAGLIVMATRQRDHFARLGFGSIADEVARHAPVPVLLVPSREPGPSQLDDPAPRHVLIPLDGSALAEEALGPAMQLGHCLGARYTLLRVVKRPLLEGDSAAGPGAAARQPCCAEAQAYLEAVACRMRIGGISVQTRVVSGRTVEGILWEAGRAHADLIALATRAFGDLKRLVLGSVADQLHRTAPIPVLIHRRCSCSPDAVGVDGRTVDAPLAAAPA